MKNEKVKIIILLFGFLSLTGCGSYLGAPSAYVHSEEENLKVSMETYNISVDAEEINLYIENIGEDVLSYGVGWNLEMLDDGEWKTIDMCSPIGDVDVFVSQVSILCYPGEIKEEKISMNRYPYDFKSGTYRLVQEISSDKIIKVEFQMCD